MFTNGGFTYPKEFSYFLLCEPNAFILNKYFDLNLPITLNSLGYFFISKKEYLQALSIFELNVELYPEAFNTHDSHGEVLLLLGREKEALEAYKRSLELNPENENARELLEKIKA